VIYKAEKPAAEVANVKKPENGAKAEPAAEPKENKQLADNNSTAKAKTYLVKKGDTLYKIAQQFSLDVNDLLQLNGLKKNASLQIGQKLKVSQ